MNETQSRWSGHVDVERDVLAQLAMTALVTVGFIAIWTAAAAMISTEPVTEATATYESSGADSSSATTGLLLAGMLAIAFVALLAVIKLGLDWLLYGVYLFVFANLATATVVAAVDPGLVVEVVLLGGVILALHYVRRWWVTATVGLTAAALAASVLGAWLEPRVILVLFGALTVFDIVAVLGPRQQMLTVVDGIPDNIPVAIPGPMAVDGRRPMLGLGDFVIPSLLVVSAYARGFSTLAVGAGAGILIAVVVSQQLVARYGPQPGLPYLCSGAVVGYVVAGLTNGGVVW